MVIAVAADHAGFPLKQKAMEVVRELGHEVIDLGTYSTEPVDYPDYAEAAGKAVRSGEADRAILLCGSGIGACVAANKLHGVRAGTCHDTFSAHQGVEDDDMNVLCLGARIIGPLLVPELIRSYLGAKFSGAERHQRRLRKVQALENAG